MKYSEFEYRRTNPDQIKKQMTEIIDGFNKADNPSEQKLWMDKSKQIFSDYSTYESMAHLNFNRDTKNASYVKEKEYFDEIDPVMREISLKWTKTLIGGKFRSELEASFGTQFFNQKELEMKSFDPKIKDVNFATSIDEPPPNPIIPVAFIFFPISIDFKSVFRDGSASTSSNISTFDENFFN